MQSFLFPVIFSSRKTRCASNPVSFSQTLLEYFPYSKSSSKRITVIFFIAFILRGIIKRRKMGFIEKKYSLSRVLSAPQVGLEPTTTRLTAGCSAIELLRKIKSGSDLSSRAVSSQVLSALKGLTSVFGMGTGGTPSSLPPEIVSYSIGRFARLSQYSSFSCFCQQIFAPRLIRIFSKPGRSFLRPDTRPFIIFQSNVINEKII